MKKLTSALVLFITAATPAFADITNPVTGNLGSNSAEAKSGNLFVTYFLQIWNALLVVGALAVLLFFLWGALTWLTSGNDKGKLEEARNRMLNAFIGMFLLVAAYTIIGFISNVLFGANFNILQPTIVTGN